MYNQNMYKITVMIALQLNIGVRIKIKNIFECFRLNEIKNALR